MTLTLLTSLFIRRVLAFRGPVSLSEVADRLVASLIGRTTCGGEAQGVGERQGHCETHKFKVPCCLCAIVDAILNKAVYIKTSIFAKQKVNDPLNWQWIAACSTGFCKYYGKYCVTLRSGKTD